MSHNLMLGLGFNFPYQILLTFYRTNFHASPFADTANAFLLDLNIEQSQTPRLVYKFLDPHMKIRGHLTKMVDIHNICLT